MYASSSILRTLSSVLPSVFSIVYRPRFMSSIKVYLVCLISGCPPRHLKENKLLIWPASIPDIWFYFSFGSVLHLLSVTHRFLSSSSSPHSQVFRFRLLSFRFVVLLYCRLLSIIRVPVQFRVSVGFSSGSMALLIARGASVSTCCPRSCFVHILDIVHVLDVSSSFHLSFSLFFVSLSICRPSSVFTSLFIS